jgi:hypothetical protein
MQQADRADAPSSHSAGRGQRPRCRLWRRLGLRDQREATYPWAAWREWGRPTLWRQRRLQLWQQRRWQQRGAVGQLPKNWISIQSRLTARGRGRGRHDCCCWFRFSNRATNNGADALANAMSQHHRCPSANRRPRGQLKCVGHEACGRANCCYADALAFRQMEMTPGSCGLRRHDLGALSWR